MKEFNRFRIVLCRPAEGGNVGAACRAMKAMGFSRLAVVSPERELDAEALRNMAVHAHDLYDAAEFHPDLASALAGSTLAVGTTRRRGKWRKAFSLPIQDFAPDAWKRQGEISIVFGNERTGLTDDELRLCQLAVSIPTSDDFPSLNLSQAVQILCWELFRARPGALFPAPSPVSLGAVSGESGMVTDRMEALGLFRHREGEAAGAFLRDLCARASLSASELRFFRDLFMKALSSGKAPRFPGGEASLQSGDGEGRLVEKGGHP